MKSLIRDIRNFDCTFSTKKKITNFLCSKEIRLIRNMTSSLSRERLLEAKMVVVVVALIGLSTHPGHVEELISDRGLG